MLISLLLDTDSQSIAIYKEYDLYYFAELKRYKDLSIDKLLDIGNSRLKECWRSLL